MRAVNPAAQTQREKRQGTYEPWLVWIEGRDRATGNPAGLGLWTGEDVQNVWVIDMFTGASNLRTFYSGGVLEVDTIRYEVGLNVQSVSITLSSISATVQQAIRGYDPRGAKVQIWKRAYDPATRKPLAGAPEPHFKGYVNGAPIERPAPGGLASVKVEVVSTARLLTITSALKKSHEAQRKRSASDTFREHKGTAREWDVPWGVKEEE